MRARRQACQSRELERTEAPKSARMKQRGRRGGSAVCTTRPHPREPRHPCQTVRRRSFSKMSIRCPRGHGFVPRQPRDQTVQQNKATVACLAYAWRPAPHRGSDRDRPCSLTGDASTTTAAHEAAVAVPVVQHGIADATASLSRSTPRHSDRPGRRNPPPLPAPPSPECWRGYRRSCRPSAATPCRSPSAGCASCSVHWHRR